MAGVRIKEENRTWVAAVLLFLLSNPMWLWGMNQLVFTFLGGLMYVISYPKLKLNKKSNWLLFAFLLQIVFLWVAVVSNQTNLFGKIQLFITFFSFATIFLCEKNYWKSIIDKYVIILAILLIPAIVEYILMFFLNVNIPYHYITECPSNPGRDYYIYNFNSFLVQNIAFERIRFFAFFDEPGVLGNIMMVLLYIQKFDLKKWYNIIFLVSGILSFSLAFYFAVIFYYLVVGNTTTKFSFVVVAIVLIRVLNDNSLVNEMLFARFSFDNGQLVGYNRENVNFDSWFSRLSISDYFLFGYSGKVEYAASWKWALVRWGIVPCFLYVFSIVYNAIRIRLKKRDLLLVFILAIIIFVQRPFFMNYLYAFLFVVPHLYLSAVQDNTSRESIKLKAVKQ